LLSQLVNERQDRVADVVGLMAQEVEVERLEIAARDDLLGRLRVDDGAGRAFASAISTSMQRRMRA
jgi:hypothetical protein